MEPGVYSDLSNADYHASSALSRTGLTLLHQRSPRHYWSEHLNPDRKPREQTPAMRLGSGVHSYVLERDKFPEEFAVAPRCDRRTKDGKAVWAEFVEGSEGKTALTAQEGAQIIAIAKAVAAHPLASSILAAGAPEVSAFWRDRETEVLCRVRPDFLPPSGYVVDLKTTQDASTEAFQRSAYSFGYPHQAAFYIDGCRAAGIDVSGDFVFIAVEKTPPYAVQVFRASKEMLAVGRREVREAVNEYAACISSGEWPGYAPAMQELELPRWAT